MPERTADPAGFRPAAEGWTAQRPFAACRRRPRRGLPGVPARIAAALAAVAVLACAALVPAPARAQSADEILLGIFGGTDLYTGTPSKAFRAQSFTTGSQNVSIGNVTAATADTPGFDRISRIGIYPDEDGEPDLDSPVGSLSAEAHFPGAHTFVPVGGRFTLRAGTTYWAVVNRGVSGDSAAEFRVGPGRINTPRDWSAGAGSLVWNADDSVWEDSASRLLMGIRGFRLATPDPESLESLTLSADGRSVPLTPAFHRDTTGYTADSLGASTVTVTAAPYHAGATVSIEGDDDPDTPGTATLALAEEGPITVRVTVTSRDGRRTRTYEVRVEDAALDMTQRQAYAKRRYWEREYAEGLVSPRNDRANVPYVAQRFRTGPASAAAAYRFEGVRIKLDLRGRNGGVRARLYSDRNGRPFRRLAVLEPTAPLAEGTNEFRAELRMGAYPLLEPDTAYHVLFAINGPTGGGALLDMPVSNDTAMRNGFALADHSLSYVQPSGFNETLRQWKPRLDEEGETINLTPVPAEDLRVLLSRPLTIVTRSNRARAGVLIGVDIRFNDGSKVTLLPGDPRIHHPRWQDGQSPPSPYKWERSPRVIDRSETTDTEGVVDHVVVTLDNGEVFSFDRFHSRYNAPEWQVGGYPYGYFPPRRVPDAEGRNIIEWWSHSCDRNGNDHRCVNVRGEYGDDWRHQSPNGGFKTLTFMKQALNNPVDSGVEGEQPGVLQQLAAARAAAAAADAAAAEADRLAAADEERAAEETDPVLAAVYRSAAATYRANAAEHRAEAAKQWAQVRLLESRRDALERQIANYGYKPGDHAGSVAGCGLSEEERIVRDAEGNPVYDLVSRGLAPVYDRENNVVTDAEGNPVMKEVIGRQLRRLRCAIETDAGDTVTVRRGFEVSHGWNRFERQLRLAILGMPVTGDMPSFNLPPYPVSASVPAAGTTLAIDYDNPLDTSAAGRPPASAFTVGVRDGREDWLSFTPSAVASVTERRVTLTLGRTVLPGQAVRVGYADPTEGDDERAVQSPSGVDGATVRNQGATNNSTAADTRPKPVSATVASSGRDLDIVFSHAPDDRSGRTPAPGLFTVTVGGADDFRVTGVTVSAAEKRVRLRLAETVERGRALTVGYRDPDPGDDAAGVLQNAAGADAPNFAGLAVTNGSTVANPAPVPVSAVLDAQGTSIDIRFSATLRTAVQEGQPPDSAFTVRVDGDVATVVLVQLHGLGLERGREVRLSLYEAIYDDQTVTVSYAAPGSGPALTSQVGRHRVRSFAGHAVTNNSEVVHPDARPPEVEWIRWSRFASTGDINLERIVIRFSRPLADYDPGVGFHRGANRFRVYFDRDGVRKRFLMGNASKTVSEVGISGDRYAVLLIENPVGENLLTFDIVDLVRVDYIDPPGDQTGDDVIQSRRGTDLPSFTGMAVSTANYLPPRSSGQQLGDQGEEEPFTASLTGAPGGHGGAPFTARLSFSEAPAGDAASVEAAVRASLSVIGGSLTGVAAAVEGDVRAWDLAVAPESASSDVLLLVSPSPDCAAAGALCTADGRALSAALAGMVPAREATRVESASLSSGPGPDGVWDEGERVEAELRFTRPVTLAGEPGAASSSVGIVLDGEPRRAAFLERTGDRTLRFGYAVPAADAGSRTARLAADSFEAGGMTLADEAGERPWTYFDAPAGEEPEEPELVLVRRVAENAAPGTPVGRPVTASDPDGDALTYTLHDRGGAPSAAFGIDASSGQIVTLPGVFYDYEIRPVYRLTVAADDGRGNRAEVAVRVELTDVEEVLTASFGGAPAAHGGAPFELRLGFSEPVGLGREALRDGLRVSGGRAVRWRRLDLERGLEAETGVRLGALWGIGIEPGARDVTVELPAVADCAAPGAACTLDGRALSAAAAVTVPAGELPALTAEQPDWPATHDRTAFDLEVAFSWPVPALHAASFAVTDGEIVDIARLEGDNARWRLRVLPLSNAAVRVALAATSDCEAAGAVCTEDGRQLSNALAWEIAPADPDAVDGAAPEPVGAKARLAVLTLVWNEGLDEASVPGAAAFAVTVAGEARGLAAADPVRVSGRRVHLALASSVHPGEAVAVDYAPPAENPLRDLAGNPAAAVEGLGAENASPALRARFERDGLPASHDGVNPARFRLAFSEAPAGLTGTKLRFETLKLLLGRRSIVARRAWPLDPADPVHWEIEVVFRKSDAALAHEDLTAVIEPTRDCADAAAVCTADGRRLAERIELAIPGVPSVSAAAAAAGESDGALAFAVRLSRARDEAVTVDWATADGTAAAGSDYEAGSGTLTFAPGQTERTVRVAVLDDAEAEGNETLTLALSNVAGGGVVIGGAEARGTIRDDEPSGPFAAAFADAPATHDGTAFTLGLSFGGEDEEVALDAAALLAAFRTVGGAVTALGQAEPGSGRDWRVTVTPASAGMAVTVALAPAADCGAPGALCTADGRTIAAAVTAEVAAAGTPGLRVVSAAVVSGPGENGTWDAGETVEAELRFSAPVTVSGPEGAAPALALLIDGARRTAAYASGSGTDTLRFAWTVPAEDAGARKARVAPDGLALNGTAIGDTQGRAAATGFATAPYVTGAAFAPEPSGDGVWSAGERLSVRLAFSEAVTVLDGAPAVTVEDAGSLFPVSVGYASGSGTDTLTFSIGMTGGEGRAEDFALTADSLRLRGARIVSRASGLAAETGHPGARAADAGEEEAPQVTGAAFAPEPSGDGVWSKGETLEVRLAFSEAVTVLDGVPAVDVTVGSRKGAMAYASGSGTDTLVFSQTFGGGRWRAETIALVADSLRLEGARIVGRSSGLAAALGHPGARADGAEAEEPQALTAAFADLPAGHGGAAFTFELAFSEAFAVSWLTVRDRAFEVTGGRVTGARRTDNPHREGDGMEANRVWRIRVEPDEGAGEVTVTLPAAADCEAAGAICTADGRPLSAAVTAAVPRAAPSDTAETVLTARFEDVPAEHAGEAFGFGVRFSEAFAVSWLTMRDHAFTVTGGRVTGARRVDNPHHEADGMEPNRVWTVSVEPDGMGDVTVELPATADCAAAGAVCTADGRPLSAAVPATVPGPPGLSVADARVEEGPDATLDFAVTLGRASASTVTVDYATADGTATAGEDYETASGTLSFAPGETAKTVSVPVLDDAHDEGGETFTLTLSNPSGGNAWLEDASATGTIENTDPMPGAWLARFGRTVAEQVIGAVEGRFSASRTAGARMTLAGHRIGLSGAAPGGPGSGVGADARPTAAEGSEARSRRGVTPRELLTGSSFTVTGEAPAGGTVSFWGRGGVSGFDGTGDGLALDGDAAGAMLGADWVRGRWTAGLMVSHVAGEGGWRGPDAEGAVETRLTGLFPYGRWEANGRVTLWGVAGYGAGELVLTPEGQSAMRADLDLMMGAAGLRGVALEAGPEGGVELAVKTDALAVRTASGRTRGLAAAEAGATRLRLGLEGSWRGLAAGAGALVPTVEIGVRHDGGDAETGFGLDLGGGLSWSDPDRGLSADFRMRGLLTHESGEFRDRGLAGGFSWAPGREDAGRGPSLTLVHTAGASASGGVDALLGRRHLGGLAADGGGPDGDEPGNRRLELRMGYGLAVLEDRFTLTPELALGRSGDRREYVLGWRLNRAHGGRGAMEFRLAATRSESPGARGGTGVRHGIGLGFTARW